MNSYLEIITSSVLKQYPGLAGLLFNASAGRKVKLAFSSRSVPPVLIYQMGKVGSTTVYNSILRANIKNPVLHLHFLSDRLHKLKKHHTLAGTNPFPYHLLVGEKVRSYLQHEPDFPIKIISMVRDPIAYAVSNLFQNPQRAKEDIKKEKNRIDVDKACIYLEKKLSDQKIFNYYNNWFDNELNQVFNFDVFKEHFPKDTGFAIYKRRNLEILLIRMEDLTEQGSLALSSFLGLDNPLLIKPENIRRKSKDSFTYQEVLNKLTIERSVCEMIYSSKTVNHFYSDSMIENFISRWSD